MQLAQGDRPAALASYRASLTIAERLAQVDPLNVEWQMDLIRVYVTLGEVTGDKAYSARALNVALDLRARGLLAPGDAWMVDELKRRATP